MNRLRVTVAFGVLTGVFLVNSGTAQVVSQSSPAPIVTAESEPWYLSGEPITYAGNIYYPAGSKVFFNANEMVRSGFYMGVPLYSRTTLEPYSIVFVPLGRGLMQPYERRREGDIAGTAGSTAPSLPTAPPSRSGSATPLQSAGPPTSLSVSPDETPQPVGTTGTTRTRIGPRPQGINAVFVEFRGQRWYRAGNPVPFDPSLMTPVGERGGFPVFAQRETSSRIYIPITAGSTLVAPYSLRRPQ